MYFLYGLRKSVNIRPADNAGEPEISVIVAGRNESGNISDCINSLKLTVYNKDSIEFILVNDNSTDDTLELMNDSVKGDGRFKVISSFLSGSSNLKGKANAIDNAVGIAEGELIISTDADCKVPEYWVKKTAEYFSKDTGMVCGFTFIEHNNSLFGLMQCIDWFYLLSLASGSSGLDKIMSCIGNNLSYSKEAYQSVGGYESIKFSVTEDLALMRKINSSDKYKILFPLNRDCLVRTKPCGNIREVFSQKRRWFRGGIGINLLGYITGFFLYAANFMLIFGLFFMSVKLYLILIFIKFLSELILLMPAFKIYDVKYLYKFYPVFSVYFAVYGLLLPLSFLFKKGITWKDRNF